MSILQVVALPFLFLIPGYLCLRALSRPVGPIWLLSIPFSIPFTCISAFLLAKFGYLSVGSLVAANTCISALLFLIPAGGGKQFFSSISFRFPVAVLAISAGFFLYYAPPFEYYFGGRDPGVYAIHGIRIGKTGALIAEDPLVTDLNTTMRKYRTLFISEKVPLRYMSFHVQKDRPGFIVPNFFHLYPVWLAVFYQLFGVHGMLFGTTFLAVCLLAIMALFIRLVQGEAEAISAMLLLGASAVMLWFARFPNSELLSGCLIFLGLTCLEGYRRTDRLVAGLFAALFLGLAFWARVDAALMGAALFIFLAFRWMDGSRLAPEAAILTVYCVVAASYLLHVVNTNPDYIMAAFYNLKFKPYKVALALSGLGAVVAGLAIAGRKFQITRKPTTAIVLSAALGVALAYAYFIRPYFPASHRGSPNEGALLALGWYFTHPLVVLSLVGLTLYAYSVRKIHWAVFAATLFYSTLYFYRIRGHAEHFWMLRRYLPVICPALAFYAVYAARRILQRVPFLRPRGSAILILLSAGLAGWLVYDSREIHRHSEYRGSFQFLDSIARRMKPEDLLIIGARESNDLHIIGPMLSYYFERNVLVIREADPGMDLLSEFVNSWKGRVFFIGAGNTNLASGRFYLAPDEEIRFETPVYDEVYHDRPRLIFQKPFLIGWYRVQQQPSRDPYFVDVGKYDDGSITNFYLKEEHVGVDYRWTNGQGHVYFPPSVKSVTGVVLQMNPGPWVPGMERVRVKVYVNELLLVDLLLRNGYNTYEVPVPDAMRAKITGVPVDIRIESKSWIPKRILNLPDLRRVGVIVDWVKLKTGP